MDIRKQVAPPVHTEILAENLEGQPVSLDLPAGPLGRLLEIDSGDALF
jgi:hypothetical protein